MSEWSKKVWLGELPRSNVMPFLPYPNFTCTKCDSHENKWLVDKHMSGMGVQCLSCGYVEAMYRHWRHELKANHDHSTFEAWVENYITEKYPAEFIGTLLNDYYNLLSGYNIIDGILEISKKQGGTHTANQLRNYMNSALDEVATYKVIWSRDELYEKLEKDIFGINNNGEMK